jgi:sugar phosphate isomerase/epimerase
MIDMKYGFSTLALFMNSFETMLDKGTQDGFKCMEILCEGPYWPRNILGDKCINFEIFESYDMDIFLHAPTVDLNPASVNPGIREETKKQMKETVDLAIEIEAKAITTHPGIIRREEERLRGMAIEWSIENIIECVDYSDSRGISFSIENMPNRYVYLANSAHEHELIVRECGCNATVDMGHANTTSDPSEFLNINKTIYFHLSDNDGQKDQHLPLGDGSMDLNLLKNIKVAIIELNSYKSVLKSKKVLNQINNRN